MIPKGTTVLTNVWSIQRREEDYDEPEKFMPERYLDNPLGIKSSVIDTKNRKATYTFGAGRRVCPGMEFAESSILVVMSKLLWTFNIVSTGNLDISVETGYHSGLVLGPHAFQVDFVPRDGERAKAAGI